MILTHQKKFSSEYGFKTLPNNPQIPMDYRFLSSTAILLILSICIILPLSKNSSIFLA